MNQGQSKHGRRLAAGELADRLHVSWSTIDRWVKLGQLPRPHKLGARRMWFEDEIAQFENERMSRGVLP